MRSSSLLAAKLLALMPLVNAQAGTMGSYNGLAVTPAMGWDNWNAFGCSVSEDLLLGTAQKIVTSGLRDLGYNYVILDDCWSNGRYDNGTLRPDFSKFPNGMKHVGDQLHAMGLKFGMYSSAGYLTCGRYAASLGREDADAQTFADWGVDYLKYDNCYNGGQEGNEYLSYTRYNAMSMALNKTGRPILYSMCNWGSDGPWNWAQTMANSWRMSGDVYDSFSRPDVRCPCTGDEPGYVCQLPGFHCSILNIMNKQARIVSKTQSGAQNDMDMLEVGNGGMSDAEYLTHMSLWALASSPLIIGTDLRKLSPSAYSIYANPAVLALNQDPAVSAGVRKWRYPVADVDAYGAGDIQLWTRVMGSGDRVIALVNAGNSTRGMNASLEDVFLDEGGANSALASATVFDVYDLWGYRMDNATAAAAINGTLPPMSMIMGDSGDVVVGNETTRWNTTVESYASGLARNASALMGKLVGQIQPGGRWEATVPRHGVGLFRLRARPGGMGGRDEL